MSVKVTVDTTQLSADLDRLVRDAIAEVRAVVVDVADDVEEYAEGKWYTQVHRRTGETGTALETESRTRGTVIEAVVLSRNKVSYMVHRPGPLSVLYVGLKRDEYIEAMSLYRRTGQLPPGVEVRKYRKSRPVGLHRKERNPLASDGKTLWSQLVLRDGSKLTLARAGDVDKAIQRAADKLRR